MKLKLLLPFIIAFVALGIVLYFNSQSEPLEYHTHADFKVYLNGSFINFSQDKFQSNEEHLLSQDVHLHDGNGNIIHFHKAGITMKDFFNSINMDISNNCFVDDLGHNYCNNKNYSLEFYVNGLKINNYENYVSKDLDRILIAYVNKNENISKLLDMVTNDSCIQSEKCPERGKPSDESSCTGTSCEFIIE